MTQAVTIIIVALGALVFAVILIALFMWADSQNRRGGRGGKRGAEGEANGRVRRALHARNDEEMCLGNWAPCLWCCRREKLRDMMRG